LPLLCPANSGAHFARFLAWLPAGFCPAQFARLLVRFLAGILPRQQRRNLRADPPSDSRERGRQRPAGGAANGPLAVPLAARWRLELTFIALLTYVVNLSRVKTEARPG